MNRKAISLALALTAVSMAPVAAQAGSAAEGKDVFETCRGCHSQPGYSNAYPTYYVPKIGGQVAAYTEAALQAYKESKRPHGTMMANSINLTDKKIADVAAYIQASNAGSSKAIQNGGDVANGKKLAAACLGCHNDDSSATATNPRLAGQHANYLEKALKGYQAGQRNNALMQSMVSGLSATDIKDIAAYFTSLKGLTTVE